MSLLQALQMAEEEIASHEKVLIQALDEIKELKTWINKQEPRTAYEAVLCPICHKATEDYYMRPTEQHKDGCPWRVETRGPTGKQIRPQPFIRR